MQKGELQMKNVSNIPSLNTSQFDEFLFPGWKPPNYSSYHQFHVTRIEQYVNHLKVPVLPHRRAVNFFIFLTKGKAIRSKGLKEYEILENHFYFLPADQITSLTYVSKDAEGFYCHFSTEVLQHKMLQLDLVKDFSFFSITANPVCKITNAAPILKIMSILEKEYRLGEKDRFELIPFYLITMFIEIKKQSQAPIIEKKHQKAANIITERYLNALQQFVNEKKTVAEYAAYLAISKNHLHKCVKSVTGKSAHNLLADMRILEAKVLLKQSNLSVGEIAFKSGNMDQSDFSRFFKTWTGMTPKEYRKIED